MSRLDSLYTQVSAVGATPPSPRIQGNLHDTSLLFSQMRQGQVFSGEVLSQTSQTTYLIKIGQQLIELPLTGNFHSGDTLHLRLTSHTPEIQISLIPQNNDTARMRTFQMEHVDGKFVFRELTEAAKSVSQETSSSVTDLSNAGKLLDKLSSETSEEKATQLSARMLQFSPQDSLSIQQALENSVKHSGIFMLSHFKKLLDGKLSTAELMNEIKNLNLTQAESDPASSMVANQLHALEHQEVILPFQAPENVHLDWRIAREDHQQNQDDNGDTNQSETWLSELTLSFPELGTIGVKLSLFGNHLSLSCKLTATSAALLQTKLHLLQAQIQNTGVEPQIQIISVDVT